MGMPFSSLVTIPNDAPATPPAVVQAVVAEGDSVHLGGHEALGYDIELDGAAGFTADLEASVDGRVWTVIAAIATGDGALGEHYQYARVNVSVDGDLGDDTRVRVFGKARS